jgi:hypothetical protein
MNTDDTEQNHASGPSALSAGLERAAFESWALQRWGTSAWLHINGCCGEWEAWQAATAAEREACADVCELQAEGHRSAFGKHCAAMIRMRSNNN